MMQTSKTVFLIGNFDGHKTQISARYNHYHIVEITSKAEFLGAFGQKVDIMVLDTFSPLFKSHREAIRLIQTYWKCTAIDVYTHDRNKFYLSKAPEVKGLTVCYYKDMESAQKVLCQFSTMVSYLKTTTQQATGEEVCQKEKIDEMDRRRLAFKNLQQHVLAFNELSMV